MTPPWYRKQEMVFTALGIGIAASLIFLPLLTAFLSILLFVYWLVFATKSFAFGKARTGLMLLFASLYILAILGSFYSANTDEAMFRLQQKSGLIVYPLVFGTISLSSAAFNRILLAFAWCTCAGCLACLGYGAMHFIQTGSPEMMYGYQMVILKDMSPFMLGLFCLLSCMYLVTSMQRKIFAPGKERITYVAMLIFLSLFLFVLGNRNVLFSWGVVVVFFLLKNIAGRAVRLLFIGLLVAAFAAAAAFNPALKKQVRDLTDFSESNTIQLDSDKSLGRSWGGKALRLAIWKCSMDLIGAYPLTGVGTGDVQDSLQAAYERRQFYFASRYNLYNAHNQFIQETLAYGITGFLLFTSCLLVPFFRYFKSAAHQLYVLFLLSFILICFTESILEISKGIIFYSFFNSIFAFVLAYPQTIQKKQY